MHYICKIYCIYCNKFLVHIKVSKGGKRVKICELDKNMAEKVAKMS